MPSLTARAGTAAVRAVDVVVVVTSLAVAWYFSGLARFAGASVLDLLDGGSWAGTWVAAWLVSAVTSVSARVVRASRARRRGGDWVGRLPSARFGLVLLASSVLVMLVGANFLISNTGDDIDEVVEPLGFGDELGQLRQVSVVLLVVAWVLLQTNYAERYARIWARDVEGRAGVRSLTFPGAAEPTFSDFFYFAVTVGVSFATPDVEVRSSRVRSKVTVHVLLSFVYSTVILAALVGVITA